MAFALREYQKEAVEAALKAKVGEAGVIDLPTGTGKSLVIAEIAHRLEGKILVLSDRKEILEQNREKLKEEIKTASFFCSGIEKPDLSGEVVFASIGTANSRIEEIKEQNFKAVIIDECHKVPFETGSQYIELLNEFKNSLVIGMTATPYRGTGVIIYDGEAPVFKKLLYSYDMKKATEDGFLTPLVVESDFDIQYAVPKVISSQSEVDGLLASQKELTNQILEKLTLKGQSLIFCANVLHSEYVAETLQKRGLDAKVLHGGVNKAKRKDILKWFKETDNSVLVGCDIFTTGFDAPKVETIVLLRRMFVPQLFVQIAGRGTRLSEGKTVCTVKDYAGNVDRFGDVYEIGELLKQRHFLLGKKYSLLCPKGEFYLHPTKARHSVCKSSCNGCDAKCSNLTICPSFEHWTPLGEERCTVCGVFMPQKAGASNLIIERPELIELNTEPSVLDQTYTFSKILKIDKDLSVEYSVKHSHPEAKCLFVEGLDKEGSKIRIVFYSKENAQAKIGIGKLVKFSKEESPYELTVVAKKVKIGVANWLFLKKVDFVEGE